MAKLWKIELMGGLRLTRGSETITHFRTYKTGALLAYLAYQHSPQPREHLIDLLWADGEIKAGRQNLRTALAALRRQLEADAPPGSVLRTSGANVELDANSVETDVEEFNAALEEARTSPDDEAQAQALERALDFYSGPLLPAHYEDWMVGECRRLEELFFQALRRLIKIRKQCGELADAGLLAQRGLSQDPLREELHFELMRLFVAQNNPQAALRQYQDLTRLLDEKLGMTPGEEVRALAATLDGAQPAATEYSASPQEAFRILVVEDDNRIARLILRSLRQAGFEGFHACDGESGLAMMKKIQPHLVLLDLAMPRMNGLEACEKIRQSSDVPVIIATAQQEHEAQIRAFALGADDYILKPFQPSLLIARVQANLRRVYQYKTPSS